MLLLIAVANAPSWVTGGPASSTALDRAWVWVRTLLVDGRIYPLFAILVGFGVASIAARPEGAVPVRALLFRRGLVLVGFGAVHALVFPGDVLGAYGLTILLLGGAVVGVVRQGRSTAPLIAVAAVVMLLGLGLSLLPAEGGGGEPGPGPSVLGNLTEWLGLTLLSVPFTAIVPCFVIGVLFHRSKILTRPERHRRFLTAAAAVGLGSAALLGIPWARTLDDGYERSGAFTLDLLGGYPGGVGWLALIALAASYLPSRTGSTLTAGTATAWLLTAVGRRSLSCYLLQSIAFALVFTALQSGGGRPTATTTLGVAVAVWLAIAALAALLHRFGLPGPAEWVSRALIHRGVPKKERGSNGMGAPTDPSRDLPSL